MKAERAMISPLTGLRAVAAVWAVLFHLREYLAALAVSPAVQAVAGSGLLGVGVFFILSGFIIIALASGKFAGGCLLFAAFRAGAGKSLPWEWLVPAFAGAGIMYAAVEMPARRVMQWLVDPPVDKRGSFGGLR